MKNREVANILYEIGDFLEIQDVAFKPRAYRRAARNVEALNEPIEDRLERDDLEEIEGVGEAIADKITEYLETGELEYYNELKAELPIDIDAITRVEGLGPKSAKKLYDALDITNLDELQSAAETGKIAEVAGFGEKTQQNILDHIELARQGEERMLLGHVFSLVRDTEEWLTKHDVFDDVRVVGSFRRRRPTIGDIDILATSTNPSEAMTVFTTQPDVVKVLSKGETRSTIRLTNDLQMDLRIVDRDSYGAAMQYFTGSKNHNITVRNRAIEYGWKLNEYGLFDENDAMIAGATEEEVYERLGLSWIPPELREDTSEVEAAATGELPVLVDIGDIRGDLQLHTNASDGSNSIREMAEKAEHLGYEYVAITDHGPSLQVASGISREEFEEQRNEIRAINESFNLTVLHGIEANVITDGLDITREWCEAADIVVFALHDRRSDATDRIVSVMEDYPVDILAHPQNRLINERRSLKLDLQQVLRSAAENDVAIEINAQPDRLDLDWESVKFARELVPMVVSTDAHVTSSMDYMELGVSQARRGWCEASNVLNTRTLDGLREFLDG